MDGGWHIGIQVPDPPCDTYWCRDLQRRGLEVACERVVEEMLLLEWAVCIMEQEST
jgi:hypothetical protein